MTEGLVLREDSGGIATLTLNDPKRLNVLSDAMLAALDAALAELAEDRAVRVVILRGAGRSFCAGHDLREMSAARQAPDGGRAAYLDLFERAADVMLALTRLPQPVIAGVHGIAAAAGCQLVASCDLAVAAHGTRFGVNGVNIGLFCSTAHGGADAQRRVQEGVRAADDRRPDRGGGGGGDRSRQPGGAGG